MPKLGKKHYPYTQAGQTAYRKDRDARRRKAKRSNKKSG